MNTAIIFDCEFLCLEGSQRRFWCAAHDPDPVIAQIGAVKLGLDGDAPILDRFSAYVRPIDRFGNPVGVILQTASPFETPQRMEDLTAWYAREAGAGDAAMHPLLRVGVFVVVFLQIHPFQDGNGRLSRLLTTLLLLQGGYSYTPYSSFERLVERRRDAYYRALRQTQGTLGTDAPDWTPWLTFFLEILHEQTRDLAARVAGEHALAASPPEREAIVRHVRERERVTMRDLVTLTGMNRNTLKGHLRALVGEGRLVLHGSGRGSWYALP